MVTVLMTSTLDIQLSVTDQDIQTGVQDHHQDQMTDIMKRAGTVEGGAEASGQEIIKMGVVDMTVLRGSSGGPGVLQEITETQIIDTETGMETIKMTGGGKERDMTREGDGESTVMNTPETPSA